MTKEQKNFENDVHYIVSLCSIHVTTDCSTIKARESIFFYYAML